MPLNVSETRALLTAIKTPSRGSCVYLHCRAGIGRTGLVVGCLLAEESGDGKKALARLNELWQQSARATHQPRIPQTLEQADYIRHCLRLRALASAPSAISIPPVSISEESGNSALLPPPPPAAHRAGTRIRRCRRLRAVGHHPDLQQGVERRGAARTPAQRAESTLPGAYESYSRRRRQPPTAHGSWPNGSPRPTLRVMRRTSERGLASAVARGWQVSRGTYLCAIDADLQHPPGAIVELLALMERGADMAVASRHVEGRRRQRLEYCAPHSVASRPAPSMPPVLPSVVGRVSDPMSGYFMIRRSAIESVELSPLGYKILIEVLARGRFPWVGEVPLHASSNGAYGGSKATARVYLDYLRHLTRLRFSSLPFKPLRAFRRRGAVRRRRGHGTVVHSLSDPTVAWNSGLDAQQT